MNKPQITEQIQRELAEYRTLTNDEEKASFWVHICQVDTQLTKEDRFLINEVIHDDLQAAIIKTKALLHQAEPVKNAS